MLNAAGQAGFATANLAVASHTITASYVGGPKLIPSSGTVTQDVSPASTATTIVSAAPAGIVFGQAVKFTATVSILPPGGGTLSGTVSFYDDGNLIGTSTLNTTTRQAAIVTKALEGGRSHVITAVYNGNTNFASSSSADLTQPVASAVSTTSLTSSPGIGEWAAGVPLTFTATVNGRTGGVPTGSVLFTIDSGAETFTQTITAGKATLVYAGFTATGTHTVQAEYVPSVANFLASSSPTLSQNVLFNATLTPSFDAALTPIEIGDSITLSVLVEGASGTPTGTVDFYDGAKFLGQASLDANGRASLVFTTELSGTRPIRFIYNGDGTYQKKTANLSFVVSAIKRLV